VQHLQIELLGTLGRDELHGRALHRLGDRLVAAQVAAEAAGGVAPLGIPSRAIYLKDRKTSRFRLAGRVRAGTCRVVPRALLA
jgi:hypothetical protein